MTTNLAREYFRIECDKRSVGAYDTFILSEIDHHISFAIRQFYERRLSGFTKDRTSFEEWQKRSEDLRPVYGIFTASNIVVGNKRGCKYAKILLPGEDELWHVLSEECKFTKRPPSKGAITDIYCDVYECTSENITSRINNSLGDHIYYANKIRPLRVFTFEDDMLSMNQLGPNKRIMSSELYYIDRDDVLLPLSSYKVEYIKKPGGFGTTIPGYTEANANENIYQVPDYAWDDVISIAVSHALENNGSPRVGTYSQEQQLIQ